MPLYKTIPLSGGMIGVWQLTETSAELLPDFSSQELADPDFQQYSYEKRKVEWLAIRLLIKQLIGSDFMLSYFDTGKPILNHSKFKHISISHSRDFVAVFIHEKLNLGIDIENISRNYIAIEKKYLSETEEAQVDKNPILHSLYWCAKEAIFKLVPDEGVDFKHQIRISPFNPELNDQFQGSFHSGNMESNYTLHYQIFSDNCMVWVTA